MHKVLILSYYFPPMGMGGTQRSAKFVKYLPDFNWEPYVVTVKDIHYYAHDETLLTDIQDRTIYRTESWDPLRILARLKKKSHGDTGDSSGSKRRSSKILNFINSVLVKWLLIPDSKILWLPFAITKSFVLIKKYKIRVVYTTSPPQSAHLGGLILKWLTGVRWVADFRDDWTGGESQPCPTLFHLFINRLEEKFVLKLADKTIAMCQSLTLSLQKKSGEQLQKNKFLTIMNGYDKDDFKEFLDLPLNRKFTITHCGSISNVSDPEAFLKAVAKLFNEKPELRDCIQINFFGTDIFGRLSQLCEDLGLQNYIQPICYLAHHDSVAEMMKSHVLLLTILQKTNEEIISGKVFEYFASGKPILNVTSKRGEVAKIIEENRRGTVCYVSDVDGIKNAIFTYYNMFDNNTLVLNKPLSLDMFNREKLTEKLSKQLEK